MIAEAASPFYLILTGGLLVSTLNAALRREWAAVLAFAMAAVLAGMAGSLPPSIIAKACGAYAVLLTLICGGWIARRLGLGLTAVLATGIATAACTAHATTHLPGPQQAGLLIETQLAALIR